MPADYVLARTYKPEIATMTYPSIMGMMGSIPIRVYVGSTPTISIMNKETKDLIPEEDPTVIIGIKASLIRPGPCEIIFLRGIKIEYNPSLEE